MLSKIEKVLVTGAGGFIGSHLVDSLLKKGYKVSCLLKPGEDLLYLKDLDVVCINGDITDKKALHSAVKGVSYIYHLAGRMGGRDNPEYLYKVNSEGTNNLIQVCIESGIELKRFLFVSSVAIIGATGNSGVADETTPPNPTTDYGKSKLKAENYLRDAGDKIPYTIIRLPLVYGPRCLSGLHIVFKLVNSGVQILPRKCDITLGYVKDMVSGMILAAENPVAVGQTYFLGEDRAYCTHEIYQHIVKVMEKRTLKLRLPYKMLYIIAFLMEKYAQITKTSPLIRRNSLSAYLNSNWRFSVAKAGNELHFQPDYPFEKGLKMTAAWYRKNGLL